MRLNNQKGFVSLIAMVTVVAVVGGGTVLGIAAIDNVARAGCGDRVEEWRSGSTYADIAANKDGTIEDAQKCQEAVVEATKVAKANAALLGRASNISGKGGELILTEIVNTTMDYVEKSSKINYKPIESNNKPPQDIQKALEDKELEKKATEEALESRTAEEESIEEECYLTPSEDGIPVVKASCDNDNIGFWYADKDGDISKLKARFRINVPEFGGEQEFEWDSINYSPTTNPICGFESSFEATPPPASLGGYDAQIYVDIQLIDSGGNVSNTSSCRVN